MLQDCFHLFTTEWIMIASDKLLRLSDRDADGSTSRKLPHSVADPDILIPSHRALMLVKMFRDHQTTVLCSMWVDIFFIPDCCVGSESKSRGSLTDLCWVKLCDFDTDVGASATDTGIFTSDDSSQSDDLLMITDDNISSLEYMTCSSQIHKSFTIFRSSHDDTTHQ